MSLTKKILHMVVVISFLVLASCGSASVSSNLLLGVSPQDEKFFKTASDLVRCKDGSKTIHKGQLNDDFCDCPDGSDEPGTSACPNGRFYCFNAGHIPLVIYSSRVNDGICDCCDGSDEYGGVVKCSNTCWEAGKLARDKLKKKISTYEQGVTLRKKEVDQAKSAFAQDKEELSKLKDEKKTLKGVVDRLKEQKEQIEKAEEEERLKKEQEKTKTEAYKEAEGEGGETTDGGKEKISPGVHDSHVGNLEDSVEQEIKCTDAILEVEQGENPQVRESLTEEPNQIIDHSPSDSTAEPHNEEKEVSDDTQNLSKEELGRLVASRWTGENDEKTGEADSSMHGSVPEEAHKDIPDEYEGYNSETEEDEDRYDDHDSEEHMSDDVTEDDTGDTSYSYTSDSEDDPLLSASKNLTWFEKIQNTVKNLMGAVNLFQTPVNISDAEHVRKQYNQYSDKLSKIESRISSLSKKINYDFGPEKEFYSFYDHCFESKQNKYVYKVCPFKQASQTEGYSTTRLGQWETFEESYRVMVFSNGDKCWNGPDRSIKVRLRCGLENSLIDVDEPSRCEYAAILTTPNVCLEEKLKELRQKLEKMSWEQPQEHDEL